jgi:hypothetical protein
MLNAERHHTGVLAMVSIRQPRKNAASNKRSLKQTQPQTNAASNKRSLGMSVVPSSAFTFRTALHQSAPANVIPPQPLPAPGDSPTPGTHPTQPSPGDTASGPAVSPVEDVEAGCVPGGCEREMAGRRGGLVDGTGGQLCGGLRQEEWAVWERGWLRGSGPGETAANTTRARHLQACLWRSMKIGPLVPENRRPRLPSLPWRG